MISGITRAQRRAVLWSAAVMLLGAGLYRAAMPGGHAAFERVAATAPGERDHPRESRTQAAPPPPAPPEPRSPPGANDSETEIVAQYASEKYELLLEDLGHMPAERFEALSRLLVERELIAGRPSEAAGLSKADADIRAMLLPSEQAAYESLKDSDLELHQLNEYAGGIGNVAPLAASDRKSILRTKLAYKARFRQLVADLGLMRDNPSSAEREYAYAIASQALRDYQSGYLQEVRQYLSDEEQFALLRNFESTEFSAELAKLRESVQGG